MTEQDIIAALLEAAHDNEETEGWMSVTEMFFELEDTNQPLSKQTILKRLKRIQREGRLECRRIKTADTTLDGTLKVIPVYRIKP